jgi:DNA-binding response OmpR family regulator
MNKKKVVLADNSYTIRRIVELSFTEEEDIELISFENGLNLKERLSEIVPDIVLVDIKLPEFNGYDVCKFINQTDTFKKTKVFLMKGGFEPINEELLKELDFIDIITKPFDSNALVGSIKKVLSDIPAKTPASMPEDISADFPDGLPEIDSFESPAEEISFSDVKDEIQSNDLVGGESDLETERFIKDEVLPSEEITQGAQPDREDRLRPELADEMENPFTDEDSFVQGSAQKLDEEELNVKRHIKEQERELEIESLTQEEMNIKKMIEEKQKEEEKETFAAPERPGVLEDETSERYPGKDRLTEESEVEEEAPDFGEDFPFARTPQRLEEIESPKSPAPPPEAQISDHEMKEAFALPEEPPKEEPVEIQKPAVTREEEKLPEDMTTPQDRMKEMEDFLKETRTRKEVPEIPEVKETEHEVEPGLKDFQKAEEIPSVEREELIKRAEDKLTAAVKEILWEIAPPIAEKIIKEEIKKIKAELDQPEK